MSREKQIRLLISYLDDDSDQWQSDGVLREVAHEFLVANISVLRLWAGNVKE